MKRRKLAFLIVPIILLAFVSCEDDIFGTISDFMGQTGENVLVSGGLVSVNTQQVDAVSQSVSTMASVDDTGKVIITEETMTQVKKDLKNVLDSPQKTEALKTDLAKDISDESQTTADKLETKLDEMKAGLGIDDADLDFEIKTEADLLVATLIVDIANKVEKVEDLDEDDDDYEDQLIALASDALFVVEVIKAVSPTGMVDLDDAVNDLFTSFLNDQEEEEEDRGARATRDTETGEVLEEFIIPILKPVLIATDSSKDGSISVKELKIMTRDYALMRKSYEDSAPGLVKQDGTINKPMKISNLIDYALSVVFSTGNRLLVDYTSTRENGDKLLGFLNDVWDFIRAYELDDDAEITEYLNDENIEDIGKAFETYTDTDAWTTVENTLLNISRAIPRNSAMTEMLNEFFTDLASDE